MNIYLDSSALIKRSLDEPESEALIQTLESHIREGATLSSSTLAWIESPRAVRSRLDDAPPADVADMIRVALSGVLEYPITDQVADVARRLGPASMRSLDAIHLATATLIGADLVCAYDQRLLISAEELGFRTASPGATAPS